MNETIAILEDSRQDAEKLKTICSSVFGNAEIRIFENVECFLQQCAHCDLLLCDVYIGETDMIDSFAFLIPRASYVIFTSIQAARSRDAFGYKVIGFLDKNDSDEQLAERMRKIHYLYFADTFLLRTKNGDTRVHPMKILYVSMENRRMYVYTADHQCFQVLEKSLRELQDEMPAYMCMISRSQLVNLYHIHSIDEDRITLTDGTLLFASRRMRSVIQLEFIRRVLQ